MLKSRRLFANLLANITLIEMKVLPMLRLDSKRSKQRTMQLELHETRRKHEQEQMFSGFGGGGNPFGNRGGFAGMGGMEDVFSQMFGKSMAGAQQQQRSAPRPPQERGHNANAWIDLTPEEAKQGGSFNITYTQLIPGSHGSIDRKRRTLKVTVKPKSKHGSEIRIKDQGHGHPQGLNGDLIVKIRVDPGEGCRWDGDRIVKEVEVPYSTLVLGGKVTVTLPDGVKGKITIPPLSQVGDRQRVKDIDIEFTLAEIEELNESQTDAIQALRDDGPVMAQQTNAYPIMHERIVDAGGRI